ncbi:hypothetical protein pdam_00002769 [Pocillopora damicornis]|uniref:Uncharacterized protein n=1 Tax=Pocillopora damicornis TaxID=46731 RepID=A0A3M6TT37_POCDA|nr:hypothetical protein pdam_00002769 [Pocillopora damicornis]
MFNLVRFSNCDTEQKIFPDVAHKSTFTAFIYKPNNVKFGISLIKVLKANHKPHVNQTRDLTSAAFVLNENDCACEPPRFLEYDKQRNFKCTLAESGQHRDYICNLCHSWNRTGSVNCLWKLVGNLVSLEKRLITLSVHKQLVVWVSPKFYYLSRDGLLCDL